MADLERGKVRGATIIGENGQVYQNPLSLAGYAPIEGDSVMLLVQSGVVLVLNTVAVMGTAGAGSGLVVGGDPTPPTAATSGTLHMPAVQSGSYRSADGWGSPGSGRGMSLSSVGQGTAPGSSYSYNGAWFFGSQANQIAGATWDAVRFRVGPRLHIGSYNSALTLHAYAHTSPTKPSGDVSRTFGPYDFTIAANYGGGWVGTLPSACYPTLAAGGGISITGSPYLGIGGLDVDPASGQLDADYHR